MRSIKKFFKDRVYVDRKCKICGVGYKAEPGSQREKSRLCWNHREELKNLKRKYPGYKEKVKNIFFKNLNQFFPMGQFMYNPVTGEIKPWVAETKEEARKRWTFENRYLYSLRGMVRKHEKKGKL